ncbi:MAG: hypothetical protein AABW89_04995 [Nanoarchaeota archaeon]
MHLIVFANSIQLVSNEGFLTDAESKEHITLCVEDMALLLDSHFSRADRATEFGSGAGRLVRHESDLS